MALNNWTNVLKETAAEIQSAIQICLYKSLLTIYGEYGQLDYSNMPPKTICVKLHYIDE